MNNFWKKTLGALILAPSHTQRNTNCLDSDTSFWLWKGEIKKKIKEAFPGGSVVKESAVNAGDMSSLPP